MGLRKKMKIKGKAKDFSTGEVTDERMAARELNENVGSSSLYMWLFL